MPPVEEVTPKTAETSGEEKISVDDDEEPQDEETAALTSEKETGSDRVASDPGPTPPKRPKRDAAGEGAAEDEIPHERTFLTFSDFDTFRGTFPRRKPRTPQQKVCPITRLPAKYFDPVTRLPYANLQAFRFIRETYYTQLEAKGNKEDPEVAAWIEWRQKHKPHKAPLMTQVQRPPGAFQHLIAGGGGVNAGTVASAATTPTAAPVPVPAPGPPTPNLSGPLRTGSVSVPASPSHHHPSLAGGGQGLSALASAVRSGTVLPTAASPGVLQQSVVLPVRTTPLPQTPISTALTPSAVSQLINNQQNNSHGGVAPSGNVVSVASGGVSHAIVTAALPTQPVFNVSAVAAAAAGGPGGGVHTVKIGGGPGGGGQQVRVRITNNFKRVVKKIHPYVFDLKLSFLLGTRCFLP